MPTPERPILTCDVTPPLKDLSQPGGKLLLTEKPLANGWLKSGWLVGEEAKRASMLLAFMIILTESLRILLSATARSAKAVMILAASFALFVWISSFMLDQPRADNMPIIMTTASTSSKVKPLLLRLDFISSLPPT
jgi:hypothetical protein